MERPDNNDQIYWWKFRNGNDIFETIFLHKEYQEDLNSYIDYLEKK